MGFRYVELSGAEYKPGMVRRMPLYGYADGQGSLNADMRRCRNYTRIRYGVRNPIMWKFPPIVPREMNAWDIQGMDRCLL